jgi:hypothetical protein
MHFQNFWPGLLHPALSLRERMHRSQSSNGADMSHRTSLHYLGGPTVRTMVAALDDRWAYALMIPSAAYASTTMQDAQTQ